MQNIAGRCCAVVYVFERYKQNIETQSPEYSFYAFYAKYGGGAVFVDLNFIISLIRIIHNYQKIGTRLQGGARRLCRQKMPDVVPLKFAHDFDLLSPLIPLYVLGGGESPTQIPLSIYIQTWSPKSHVFRENLDRLYFTFSLLFSFFFNLDTFKLYLRSWLLQSPILGKSSTGPTLPFRYCQEKDVDT